MKYFPFFMELSKKPVLLIGGGEVAERKLDLLLKANAQITIIAKDFSDYITVLYLLEIRIKNHILKKKNFLSL